MSKSIIIAMIVGAVNVIVGLSFICFTIQHDGELKSAKKAAGKFFTSSHQALLVLTIIGVTIFVLSAVGVFAGCLFATGALSAFCFEKILIHFGQSRENAYIETNMAAGVLVSGFSLLLLSSLFAFSDNLTLAFAYLLGVALSIFLFEIYNEVLIKTTKHLISGIEKATNTFAQKGKAMEIMLLSVLLAMIVGSQSLSGAIIPITFLTLSAIIFLVYLFAWKIVKNSSSLAIKKSLFWIALIGLIAGAFLIVKAMKMPLDVFWPFIAGIALATALHVFTRKFHLMIKFATVTGSIYLISALTLKFGGVYSLAIFAMGFAILSFITVFYSKNTSESLLNESAVITTIVLIMFLFSSFNVFVLDLSIGRVMFGLMSGVAVVFIMSVILKEIIKIGLEKSKEELPRAQSGNYKKLVQKIAGVSSMGAIATLILALAFPLTVLMILEMQSFAAFTIGLAIISFPFLLSKQEWGIEILSAVSLLYILTVVLMPILV